ncbi:hypothetical protein CMO93_03145 [Candidatus Woesearchaeota archaeon]|nr:hypothetical protein [Candidatus Woesearchaeota archaeon]|tara:strand:+ start:3079 stop:3378 length:300 start_codon:yes stop_codon:yes gene_type:complete
MKKITFLIKISKENKLRLVEPSNEIMESYLKKSEDHFESAKILLKFNKLEESISMAYKIFLNMLMIMLGNQQTILSFLAPTSLVLKEIVTALDGLRLWS